jgi:hypothetical protein
MVCRGIGFALVWWSIHALEPTNVRTKRVGISPLLKQNEVTGIVAASIERVTDTALVLCPR